MRYNELLSAARLFRYVTACLLVAAASAYASAQTRAGDVSAPSQSTQSAGPSADEDFELNIEQRRISEKDFHAETAVETDGTRGVQLGVGVGGGGGGRGGQGPGRGRGAARERHRSAFA